MRISFAGMMMSTSDYIALGTLACGLVGTLVAVTATWAKDLDASAQRIRILDEATKRTLFWDAWSKALADADPEANAADLRSKVKIEIVAAAQSVEEVYHKPATDRPSPSPHVTVSQYQEYRSSLSRIRRWFLLYNPPRWRAWVPRSFFYIYVLEAPLAPFVMKGFRDLPDSLGTFVGLVFLALFFRWLSIWAERPRALGQTR